MQAETVAQKVEMHHPSLDNICRFEGSLNDKKMSNNLV